MKKFYYDGTAKQLPPLKSNDIVRFKHNNSWKQTVGVGSHFKPRSYTIQAIDGMILRRIRCHLKKLYEQMPANILHWYDDNDESSTVTQQAVYPQTMVNMSDNLAAASPVVPPIIKKRSRYERLIRPPIRYGEDI